MAETATAERRRDRKVNMVVILCSTSEKRSVGELLCFTSWKNTPFYATSSLATCKGIALRHDTKTTAFTRSSMRSPGDLGNVHQGMPMEEFSLTAAWDKR